MTKEGKALRLGLAGLFVLVFSLAGALALAGAGQVPAAPTAAGEIVSGDAPTGDSPAVPGEDARLRGRDFVRLGELKTLSGQLKPVHGEWYLVVDGVDHELHLGDHEHRAKTGIRLEKGKAAVVRGFVYRQEKVRYVDVAVCNITLDGREYRFRNDDGSPLWRGRSAGDGAGEGEKSGQGARSGQAAGSGRGAGAGRGPGRAPR